jgi:hypothetical protein
MGPFQRIRDLVETLRAARQAAQHGGDGYQPMPPVGARGGRPALPPQRPAQAADEAVGWRARSDPLAPTPDLGPQRRARIRRWLANPQTLSDAIVLREILGPPKALRGRGASRLR